jgi:hypothetical protein
VQSAQQLTRLLQVEVPEALPARPSPVQRPEDFANLVRQSVIPPCGRAGGVWESRELRSAV